MTYGSNLVRSIGAAAAKAVCGLSAFPSHEDETSEPSAAGARASENARDLELRELHAAGKPVRHAAARRTACASVPAGAPRCDLGVTFRVAASRRLVEMPRLISIAAAVVLTLAGCGKGELLNTGNEDGAPAAQQQQPGVPVSVASYERVEPVSGRPVPTFHMAAVEGALASEEAALSSDRRGAPSPWCSPAAQRGSATRVKCASRSSRSRSAGASAWAALRQVGRRSAQRKCLPDVRISSAGTSLPAASKLWKVSCGAVDARVTRPPGASAGPKPQHTVHPSASAAASQLRRTISSSTPASTSASLFR